MFHYSNEDVNAGYVLDQDGIGLRLTAMEYWKCSEMGLKLPSKDMVEPDCKFVIAESLPEQGMSSRSITAVSQFSLGNVKVSF